MSAITNLSVSNLKKNRTRSILILFSIFLTTVLLTLIGTIGYGLMASNRVNAGKLYGKYDGSFVQVGEEEVETIKLYSAFTNIGLQSYVAEVESKEEEMSLAWVDETAQKSLNVEDKLETGNMPGSGNEIAVSREFLQQLGLENPKTGDVVTAPCRKDNQSKYTKQQFTVSGILRSDKTSALKSAYQAYVSQEFLESYIPRESREYQVYFLVNPTVELTYDDAESALKELAGKCGLNEKSIFPNNGYIMWTRDPGTETIIGCVGIALLVLLVSVVVIYNIFQVGIVQKIQEYGKLRAIGATKRQMKAVIFREGMLLALVGIPAGLAAGSAAGALIFHYLLENSQMGASGISTEQVSTFSLPVLLAVAGAAVLTVYLAMKKPMKIAASISPMEAVRYQEASGKNRGMRKGRKEMSVAAATIAHLSANRRRTTATIITMGLSCVLFVTMANLAGNLDLEYEVRKDVEHGRFSMSLDYSMNEKAYPENNLVNVKKENPLGSQLQDRIKEIPGVTGIQTRTVLLAEEEKGGTEQPISILVLDRKDFEKYAQYGGAVGNLDYDAMTENQGVAYSFSYFLEESEYKLGQELEFTLMDQEGTVPFQTNLMGAFGHCECDFIMTRDTWKSLGLNENTVVKLWVDCEKEDASQVEEELQHILSGMDHVEWNTYEEAWEMADLSAKLLRTGVYGLLGILGIIGFLNMANTIITGVVTRKRELGILQAIGMTNRQLNQMLQLEGILFSAGTVLVSLAAGCPLGYALFQYARNKSIYGINQYQFPILEIGFMILAIVLLQTGLSLLLSKNLRKESLVERIQYQE